MGLTPGRQKRNYRRLVAGIVASLLVHAVIFGVLFLTVPESVKAPQKDKVRLNIVDRVSKKEFSSAPLVGGERPPDFRNPDSLDGQVVDLAKPAVELRPDEARFLSRYDIKVDKEQVSRKKSGQPGRPGKESKKSQALRVVAKSDGETDAEQDPENTAERTEKKVLEKPELGKISNLRGFERLLLPGGAAGGRGGGLNMRLLADQVVADSAGIGSGVGAGSGGGSGGEGGSPDIFMGVGDEGSETLVNSRSFKFWDFFDRVKSAVRTEWDPGTVFRSRDPYGNVFGKKDRYTILGVVLDDAGGIRQIEVMHKSGLEFLDEEAVRSFQAAAPFPNPPAGLIDDRGRIVFRFGFLLEFGSSQGSFFWQRP